MSQKTDLQSNNTDLQSILNTINNLPEAGSGGEVSIGTFTCDIDVIQPSRENAINPFITGWTWEEFINSPLNYIRSHYDAYYVAWQYFTINDRVVALTKDGLLILVSVDGTEAGVVKTTDVVEARSYMTYYDPDINPL